MIEHLIERGPTGGERIQILYLEAIHHLVADPPTKKSVFYLSYIYEPEQISESLLNL